ncbi:MAG TPA: hypothetical protein P5328_02135 [Candidatus Paceibacterota bacterium]|nr:hypothetical protein [Candidatus Paceibacterota bacterium]HRZ34449.1 hypothetical protein [Candidatus Paceibacterota bacterium]
MGPVRDSKKVTTGCAHVPIVHIQLLIISYHGSNSTLPAQFVKSDSIFNLNFDRNSRNVSFMNGQIKISKTRKEVASDAQSMFAHARDLWKKEAAQNAVVVYVSDLTPKGPGRRIVLS